MPEGTVIEMAIGILGLGVAGAFWVLQETRTPVPRSWLAAMLVALISRGEAIERDLIGDPSQQQNFPKYQKRVEDWRSEIGEFCERELPDSGAGIIALPREGVLIGNPIVFEITRLRNAIAAQRDILKNLESYAGRTLADSFPGAPGDDTKGNALRSLITLHKNGINELLSGSSARKSLPEFNDDVEAWKRKVVAGLQPGSEAYGDGKVSGLGCISRCEP